MVDSNSPQSIPAGSAPQAQNQQQAQIQQLLQQQQVLQQQYNQFAVMLQNPQVSVQQKQQIQQQAQQVALQYQQITQYLQQNWYTQNHVNKPVVAQTKAGSKISMKWFLIGCFVLLILVVGGLVWLFYSWMNNPAQLSSVWLDPSTAKSLLQAFAGVFFGLLVFLGIWLVVVNAYRLVNVKNQSKIWYALWLVFGLVMLIAWFVLGANVLNAISSMSTTASVNNNLLVLPYISMKDGYKDISTDKTIKVIAPALMSFKLGSDYFNSKILPTLWQAQITQVVLDCGNKQTITMNLSTALFNGSCIYFSKWDYSLALNVDYINIPTWEKIKKTIPASTLTVQSDILVTPVGWAITYNDNNTEMIVGKVPAKVTFDASKIFKDFGLANYKIIWDVNWDWSADKEDASFFTYVYKKAWLYSVTVRFPELNNALYTFPLRVEQSDVPVCEISSSLAEWTKYNFSTNFLESTSSITDYQFSIIDTANRKKPLQIIKSKNGQLSYTFPASGIYAINLLFVTDAGKQWSCESDDVIVWATDFNISYDVYYKNPQTTNFVQASNSGIISFVDNILTLDQIPTLVQVRLWQILPDDPNATRTVSFDGKPVLSSDNKIFEFKVEDVNTHTVTILVQNPNSWAKTEKSFTVSVNRDAIIGKLLIKPDTVWTDPFTVTLDASTTTLNDSSDEIVYFTWDFGDGEIKRNLSQAIIQHVYRYDATKENWTFTSKVTITTKKGITKIIQATNAIIVKKQNLTAKINIDSHPAQVARAGDRVSYSLEINWLPDRISWDFGNGKTLECRNRECIQATTMYDQPWNYLVKVKISYSDKPQVEWSVNLKVQ